MKSFTRFIFYIPLGAVIEICLSVCFSVWISTAQKIYIMFKSFKNWFRDVFRARESICVLEDLLGVETVHIWRRGLLVASNYCERKGGTGIFLDRAGDHWEAAYIRRKVTCKDCLKRLVGLS